LFIGTAEALNCRPELGAIYNRRHVSVKLELCRLIAERQTHACHGCHVRNDPVLYKANLQLTNEICKILIKNR